MEPSITIFWLIIAIKTLCTYHTSTGMEVCDEQWFCPDTADVTPRNLPVITHESLDQQESTRMPLDAFTMSEHPYDIRMLPMSYIHPVNSEDTAECRWHILRVLKLLMS